MAQYKESNIRVLEGLEAVRVRPGMYIGSTGETGLHHLVYEVVDNSIDEVLAGRANTVDVKICVDGSVVVTDNGSGIPIEKHHQTKLSTLETVLTILHAGGKFDSQAYQYSGGLHGVGVSVVNALSKKLEAYVKRDGYEYHMSFSRGKKTSELEKIGKSNSTGTKIVFWPDDEIFETVEFKKEILMARFKQMAFLNQGVKINFYDERDKTEKHYHYEGGLSSFVKELNKKKTPIFPEIIQFTGERDDVLVDIAFQYTNSYSETILSFANNINTIEGGTHLTGFKSALTKSLNEYGRKYNLIKEKEENLSGDDAREGMTAVVSIKISNPQFEGQTKGKLGNSEVRGAVDFFFSEQLSYFLEENPSIAKGIINKALASQRARVAARKARDTVRSKNSILERATLPGKLADCQETDISVNEIFIVEGDSAGGSAKLGRDNKTQAILPLKGKIMNVEKATLDRILGYEEIQAMITAFGTGISEQFDLNKLRYGKIIIMTDADVDGAHIRTLLLTFIYRFMPDLIKKGHVYIAQPPLYRISKGKFERYIYDDKEWDKVAGQYEQGSYKLNRYKGLGEMNADQLWETTMNPDNRVLLRVQINEEEVEELDEVFNILMGDKVKPRREFIEENAKYVKHLDA